MFVDPETRTALAGGVSAAGIRRALLRMRRALIQALVSPPS